MGNQNKHVTETGKNPADKSFNKHQMFADSKVTQDKDQNCFYEVSHAVANKNIYKSWMNAVQKFQKQTDSSQRFLLLPIQSSYLQQGMCGSAGILSIKFDYFPFTLGQQISNRHNLNQPFDQKQLWYLLYVLVQTAYQFHKKNQIVGDIKSENIFVNQNGDVALYSLLALPDLQSNYFKTFIHKQITYIPPQGIADIQNGKQSPTYNQQLGESFSIGLTLLDAAMLYSSIQLYNKALMFNENNLRQLLKQFHQLELSEQIRSLIDGLLRVNIEERLSSADILQYLQPFQEMICNLQEFQPPTLSVNIQQKLKLRQKTTKKPSSRVIHLANSPHQNSQNGSNSKFLQSTEFPVYIQNSGQRELPVNYPKPQKIYFFIDPSQQGYNTANIERSVNQYYSYNNNSNNNDNDNYNPNIISKSEASNNRRNRNGNGSDNTIHESFVSQVVGSSQQGLEYPVNSFKIQQRSIQNSSKNSRNKLNNFNLKHAESKDQMQINKNNNNQSHEHQKYKSNFLNEYAKQSQSLLKKYQKISHQQTKNKSAPFIQQNSNNFKKEYAVNDEILSKQQAVSNYGYDQTSQLYNNRNIVTPISHQNQHQHHQQYSFGTGHLSNKLTNMGRITTSITPNYSNQPYQYQQREVFNKYAGNARNMPISKDISTNNYSSNGYNGGNSNLESYSSNNYKIQNYPKKGFSNQHQTFQTGHHHQSDSYVPYVSTSSNYFNNGANETNKNYQNYSSKYQTNQNQSQPAINSNPINQYNDIFSAIDKQLQQSRKMYPGS